MNDDDNSYPELAPPRDDDRLQLESSVPGSKRTFGIGKVVGARAKSGMTTMHIPQAWHPIRGVLDRTI